MTAATSVDLSPLKAEVLAVARQMSADGMAPATWGNVSARHPATGLVVITPSGMAYDSLAVEDICVVDQDGNLVEGKWKPSVETPLHCLFYRGRADVCGIVHTHSLYATAFACVGKPIPVIIATLASAAGGEVAVAPYATAGTEEFATSALAALGDRMAVLLANHGVVTVGKTLAEAYTVAEVVENAAKICAIATGLGQPLNLPAGEVAVLREHYLTVYGQK
jgi:L-ribulose-5-phosphate 4-epimerase